MSENNKVGVIIIYTVFILLVIFSIYVTYNTIYKENIRRETVCKQKNLTYVDSKTRTVIRCLDNNTGQILFFSIDEVNTLW